MSTKERHNKQRSENVLNNDSQKYRQETAVVMNKNKRGWS